MKSEGLTNFTVKELVIIIIIVAIVVIITFNSIAVIEDWDFHHSARVIAIKAR